MSHKHHNCACEHENVKYCKTCRLIHCIDCNQEWTARSFGWYNNTPYITYGNGTIGGNWQDKLGNAAAPEITLTTTCEHK